MTEEPKLPRKPERDGEAERLTGIGSAGPKDVISAEMHESAADGDPTSAGVSVKKPRAGEYYRYVNLKNIAHEES